MADPVPARESPVSWFIPYGKLLDAFTFAKLVVRARATLPVLTHALLSVDERDRVLVSATDLEQSVVTVIDSNIHFMSRPAALLPVAATLKALKALGSSHAAWDRDRHEVQITVYADTITLSVFGMRAVLEAGPPAADYPKLPDWYAPSVELVRMPVAWWRAATLFTAVARGTNDTLPMLTGIFVNIDGARVEFVSTDKYRLAISSSPVRPRPSGMPYPKRQLLLPGQVIGLAGKLGEPGAYGRNDVLRARLLDGGFVLIRDNHHLVITRLLDATFPPYQSLIPDPDNQTHWTVSRSHLLAAVKVAATGLDRSDGVRVRFNADGVTIGSCEPIPAQEKPSRDVLTSFNAQFLAQALTAFKTAHQITFSGSVPGKSWLITGTIAGDYFGITGSHLLMPLRLPQASASA